MNPIEKFNIERSYYLIDYDITKTLQNFDKIIIEGKSLNDIIPKHVQNNYLRILSYNVRYFTNGNNETTISSIVSTILSYTPHVVCLQEISLGNNDYYNSPELKIEFTNHFDRLLKYYYVLSVCSTPPAFYMTMYGNMILI